MRRWLEYGETRNGQEHTVVGTVKVLQGVASPDLGNERDLLVYLPPSYAGTYRTYPVVYMQDGQNVFDEKTSHAGEWRVDETLEASAPDGLEAIVVGVPHAGEDRINEYGPFVDDRIGGGRADAYLRFLIRTVKPLVEAEFRVAREREATAIVGSSMGGLLGLYAFFEHPDVFGLCGAMSPAVGFAQGAMLRYLASRTFNGGRLYVDVGTREGYPRKFGPVSQRRLPREYVLNVRRACEILREKGWTSGENLLFVEDKRASHNEAAWSRRFPKALRFLLGVRPV